MKVKKIAAACKSRGVAQLLDYTDRDGVVRQWISTDASIYPVEKMPYLTEDHLCTLLDLSEKQIEKMRITHEDAPAGICFDDAADGELQASAFAFGITYGGADITAYSVKGETFFVNWSLLEPIAIEHRDAELWLRKQPSGTPYFAVKAGLLCVGFVWPMSDLGTLAELLRRAGNEYRDE